MAKHATRDGPAPEPRRPQFTLGLLFAATALVGLLLTVAIYLSPAVAVMLTLWVLIFMADEGPLLRSVQLALCALAVVATAIMLWSLLLHAS
jgi:hypothetical protein